MNENLKPYEQTIKHLTTELGYDPSEGCECFQDMCDKLSKVENLKIDIDHPNVSPQKLIKLKVFDTTEVLRQENASKEIVFSDNPKASLEVHDKITQKNKIYASPNPKTPPSNIQADIEHILSLREERKQSRNKPKNNIISNIINIFKK